MNTSQTELLNSAKKAIAQNNYDGAVAFLEEAQNMGPHEELSINLVKCYLELAKSDLALIEFEFIDIYKTVENFELYLETLYQSKKIISFYQIPWYLDRVASKETFTLSYKNHIDAFNRLSPPKNTAEIKSNFMNHLSDYLIKSKLLYESLKTLSVSDFVQLARTAFLAPGLKPELRVSLVEDLLKLQESLKLPVFILDKLTEIDLLNTKPYFETEFLQESIALIEDKVEDVSVQQVAISQYVLLLSKLYPRFDLFIENISEFVFSFLQYFGILGDEDFDKNDNPYFALIKKLIESEEI